MQLPKVLILQYFFFVKLDCTSMGTSSSIFWDYWGKTTAKLWWSCSVECFVILELFQKAWNFRLLFFETAVMKSVKKEKINVMKCNQNFKKTLFLTATCFTLLMKSWNAVKPKSLFLWFWKLAWWCSCSL